MEKDIFFKMMLSSKINYQECFAISQDNYNALCYGNYTNKGGFYKIIFSSSNEGEYVIYELTENVNSEYRIKIPFTFDFNIPNNFSEFKTFLCQMIK